MKKGGNLDMKRLILIVGILLAVAGGFACAEETEGPPSGWKTYQNDEHGFQLYYPSDWEKIYPAGIIVGFRDPEADEFQENVVIVIESCGGMSLEEYVAQNRQILLAAIPELTISNEKDIRVHGTKGHEWIGRWTLEDVNLKQKQVMFVAHQKGYVLTCSASENTYGGYGYTFDEIINSFVIE